MEKSKIKTTPPRPIQLKREATKARHLKSNAKNKIQTRISINDERGLIIVDIVEIN